MRRIETMDLDGRIIAVKELTVAEVRQWFKSLEQAKEGSVDLVSECLIEDSSLGDLYRMTDLQPGDVDNMTPSEIEQVIAVCVGVNPHFFRLRGNLLNMGRALQQAPANTWKEPPAV